MINAGSHLLLTQNPDSHLSFFLEGKVVFMNFDPACVGLISHQGASVNIKNPNIPPILFQYFVDLIKIACVYKYLFPTLVCHSVSNTWHRCFPVFSRSCKKTIQCKKYSADVQRINQNERSEYALMYIGISVTCLVG